MDGSARDGDELVGRQLGEFQVVELLDRGGQGAVYRAVQRGLGREAAVKIVSRDEVGANAVARFLRETRLASRLDHPYAAHTYASGAEPDGLLWVAMELVRGRSLGELVAANGPLSLERYVPLLERIAEVVHTAHEQGIVHRDLKPDNVMLVTRAGRLLPKLVDFGIARATGEGAADPDVAPPVAIDDLGAPAAMTRTGAVVGSPAYMAPEQWYDPSSVGPATDVYALAALSYQVLTGRLPFTETNVMKMARAHAKSAVPALGDGFPAVLDAVIARGMAKKKDERYGSALELAAAFRAAAGAALAHAAVPMLDEALRDAYIADAPQPIAEATAALDAARGVDEVWAAAWALHDATAHWLGVVALACRARIGAGVDGGPSDPSAELLAAARSRDLASPEWIALARAIARPFAARAEVFPVPELVVALAGPAALDGSDARASDPWSALAALRSSHADAGGDDALERRRELAGVALRHLADALRSARFVLDYPLVVARGGAWERWTGTRRAPRAIVEARGELPDGEATLLSADGAPAVALAPLVRVAPPSPGAPDELFLFAGRGRRGAALRAPPAGFELPDEPLVAWYRQHLAPGTAAETAAEREAERSPYLGLATFSPDDALVFFGREQEAAAFLNQLRVRTMLVVVGPSGTGKSSFVQAGVVPALPAGWRTITVRPGATPLATLAARVERPLDGDDRVLRDVLRGGGPTVLVVDQLEELFTLCHDPGERQRYAALLVAAAGDAAVPVRVVLTLRDDFLVRAEQVAAFRQHLAPGLSLLATPARADLLRILEEPARRAGYAFDDGLAAQMVDAVVDQPGALPLLSFTAAKLWELRDRQLRRLTRKAHDSLGGVGGALAKHAEDTLAAMPPAEAQLVREAFRHLVTGEGTRAVIPRHELVELLAQRATGAGDRTATAEVVIERLVGARLLLASEGDGATADLVEVIHEALLASWPRLVGWQREDAENVRLRDQLRAAARQWDARGRRRGLLWRGDALLELRLWRARYPGAVTGVEDAFSRASVDDETRGRRIRRGVAAVAFVVLAAGVVALWQMNRRAERNASLAHDQLVAGYLEQGRKELVTGSPQIAALYLVEALRGGADPELARRMLARSLDSIELAVEAVDAHTAPVRYTVRTAGAGLVSLDDHGGVRGWSAPGVLAWRAELGVAATGMAATSDGATVAIAADDGSVRLVSTTDGAVRKVARHGGAIRRLAVAGGGEDAVAYTVGTDGVLAEVGVAAAEPRRSVVANAAGLREVLVVGDAVATGAEDGELVLWDRASLAPRWRAPAHTGTVRGLAVTPDGATLLSGGRDGIVVLSNMATGADVGALRGHDDAVLVVAVSPDGALAATGSTDGSARLWSLADQRLVRILPHRAAVVAVAFTADGRSVLTASVDASARTWDVNSGRATAVYAGHTSAVFTAVEAADGVVTSGADSTVRWWRGHDRLHHRAWPMGESAMRAVDWSPVGGVVAAGDESGALAIWDVDADRRRWRIAAHDKQIWRVRFSPDGELIASGSDDGTLRLWRVADGSAARVVPIGASVVGAVFTDPHTIYVGTEDARVLRVDTRDGGVRATGIQHHGAVWAFDFRAGRLATGADDHVVRVTDLATGEQLFAHEDERDVNAVALTPAGDIVAFGTYDGRVQLFSVDTGAAIASLEGHTDSLDSVQITADGRFVVSSGEDGTVRLWDLTGKLLQVIEAHDSPLSMVAPSGDAVVSGGADGWVRIWAIGPDPRPLPEIAGLIACRVPYQLAEQRLLLRVPSCLRSR
jgi:WD40 repeat protein